MAASKHTPKTTPSHPIRTSVATPDTSPAPSANRKRPTSHPQRTPTPKPLTRRRPPHEDEETGDAFLNAGTLVNYCLTRAAEEESYADDAFEIVELSTELSYSPMWNCAASVYLQSREETHDTLEETEEMHDFQLRLICARCFRAGQFAGEIRAERLAALPPR